MTEKTFSQRLGETWDLLVGNLVLFLPAIGIFFLNTIVYGFLALALFFGCLREFLALGYDLSNPYSIPYMHMAEFFGRFIYLITGLFVIFVLYSAAISIIHRSGWGNMFARVARGGKAGLGDYFEGITKFSGRMLWFVIVRGSIMWIPPMAVLIAAAMIGAGGGNSAAPGVVMVLFLGGGLVALVEIVIFFYTWMWRPAMFVRDMPVMDAFFEGISFTGRNIGNLLLYLFLWLGVTMAVFGALSVLDTLFSSMTGNDDGTVAAVAITMGVAVNLFRAVLALVIRVYFSIFYYKFYADEYGRPKSKPVRTPRPALPPVPPRPAPGAYPPSARQPGYPQHPHPPAPGVRPQPPPATTRQGPFVVPAPPREPREFQPAPPPRQPAPPPSAPVKDFRTAQPTPRYDPPENEQVSPREHRRGHETRDSGEKSGGDGPDDGSSGLPGGPGRETRDREGKEPEENGGPDPLPPGFC